MHLIIMTPNGDRLTTLILILLNFKFDNIDYYEFNIYVIAGTV